MTFIGRDIRLLWRDGGALAQLWLLPVLILFVAGLFVPVGDLKASIVTLITLFTIIMVTLPLTARLWHEDVQSGVLEQIALSPRGLIGMVAARFTALYMLTYLPITIITLAALHLWLGYEVTSVGIVSLLLLSASTLALAQLVAALTVSLKNGALLVALLLIPFLLPVFIAYAAVAAVPAALYLLGASAVLAVPLSCLAASAALRQQLSV